MLKVLLGSTAVGATAGVAYIRHFTKTVSDSAVPSPVDAPTLKSLLEHDPPLHVDVCQVDVPSRVSAREFARAFFTSPVFRLERKLLDIVGIGRSVSDDEINDMEFKMGDRVNGFAVVDAVERPDISDEVLFCWNPEAQGHSWLQAKPWTDAGDGTTLKFGSVVNLEGGSHVIKLMLPFHLMYAKIVLAATEQQFAQTAAAANDESVHTS
jgi:hypothetical protein